MVSAHRRVPGAQAYLVAARHWSFQGPIGRQVADSYGSPSCVTEASLEPRKICDALQAVRIFFSAGEVRIMPKAIRFNRLGGPEVLHMEDLPERQPGPGEVLLKVKQWALTGPKACIITAST